MNARDVLNKILKKYRNLEIVEVDVSKMNSTEVKQFLNLVDSSANKVSEKKKPSFFIRSNNRVVKFDADSMN
jgi:hypothetical protein